MSNPLPSDALTPEQERAWQTCMSVFTTRCSGFRYLFTKLLNANHNKGDAPYEAIMSRSTDVAMTDGKNIVINPDTFFDPALFNIPERVFVLAHEVMHNVLGDCELMHRCSVSGKVPTPDGKYLPFDKDQMNKFMDARINQILKDSRIGKVPSSAFFLDGVSAEDSILSVYAQHFDEKEMPKGNGAAGFDQIGAPGQTTGQDPSTAAGQRNQQSWQANIQAALNMNKGIGNMPDALRQMFQKVVEPEVPWQDQIETIITRILGCDKYDWTRGDQRYLEHDTFVPSMAGTQAGWVVAGGDVSGSRSAEEVCSNLSELGAILETVEPERLSVVWWNTKVLQVDELESVQDLIELRNTKGIPAGGGTRVQAFFDWIDQNAQEPPEMVVVFTDGAICDFPANEPAYPVIWASSTDATYPWGQVVRVCKPQGQP